MTSAAAGGGRVVVVGSLNVDLVTTVPRHPAPGETVLGADLVRLRGGKGANQALAARRAGAAVAIVGRIGDDADGDAYRAAMADAGVDVTCLVTTPGVPTGTALIVVDREGENAIVVAPGANARLDATDVHAAGGLIEAADVVLVQLEIGDEAVRAAADIAERAGTRLVLNASPVRDLPPALLRTADPVVVNEPEAAAYGLTGGEQSVCITLGGRGATWGGTTAAAPHVTPVDTTGAGDAFAGALAAALATGGSAVDALDAAVAAGAEATTWPGAQPV
ncbi:PfkB family carbohydrate kinase [Mumia zhuanghuii]|uniref:Ribokinase n=1 Tax=Mumia zhuanghuii TaxID=2585211 RepID=A0A5C4MMQ2_9ACTN|nr:PfkB family carbohydrate kinase [Mumia zhuanghuii]TNC30019.1 ribokinase [Mumia zhuanghuii]TNC45013.1 ribokinase [Mumia zhuanghuii]